jgi:hypothetical protein
LNQNGLFLASAPATGFAATRSSRIDRRPKSESRQISKLDKLEQKDFNQQP